jgi:hypothetical protein
MAILRWVENGNSFTKMFHPKSVSILTVEAKWLIRKHFAEWLLVTRPVTGGKNRKGDHREIGPASGWVSTTAVHCQGSE